MSFVRRWSLRALLGMLVTAGIGLAYIYWDRQTARKELENVVAQLDEAEPGWRLEQIEEKRRRVPDEANGARIVSAAIRLIPKKWESKSIDDLEMTPPQKRLPADLAVR